MDSEMDRQRQLLSTILTQAMESPVYQGNINSGIGLDDLSSIPITHYSAIKEAADRMGWDGVVCRPADYLVQTSGSTGDPKRMPFSRTDFDKLVEGYEVLMRHVGVRPEDVGWNIGGAYPLISGPLVEVAAAKIVHRLLSTMLTGDTDLIKAYKKASKADRIDVMVGAALTFYLLARACNDPTYFRDIVRGKLNRDYHLPKPLAAVVAKLYLSGLDLDKLRQRAAQVQIGLSYAEPVTAYLDEIRKVFTRIKMVDIFGSTENALIAAQLDPSTDGLCLYIDSFIAELARPEDLHPSEGAEGHVVAGIPWWQWETGMRGELLISRPGECLPLVRYATGDMIEVLDPGYGVDFTVDGVLTKAELPLIKVLGRAVDVLDYEVKDESGNLLGNKVYSRHINDALQGAQNVRWWEVFMVEGTPARMVFVVIPQTQPDDPEAFRKLLINRLINESKDPLHTIQIGDELGRFELVISPPEAYAIIQSEIDRRTSEGRPIGQLKPKRIHPVTEEGLQESLLQRRVKI